MLRRTAHLLLWPFLALAQDRAVILKGMDGQAERWGKVSRQVWEFAEVGYKEHKSSALLRDELKAAGFRIEQPVAGIPTAFIASYGSGKPVIGIIGEYDALPGLSQADEPIRRPVVQGAPGHGCGHNLFGAASAFAAVTIKNWMIERKIPGTIRFYGTPAEEGGAGKVYLVRAGVFRDVDAVLAWHPGDKNAVINQQWLANQTAKFRFHGQPAHAAGSPEQGRSAVDAMVLMSHCIDLLREHVPQETRMHYIFTKGGDSPNVVPELAELFLYIRSPNVRVVQDVWGRVARCAEAGALGTGTRLETEVVSAAYNMLLNEPLARLLDRNMRSIGGYQYSAQEKQFADQLLASLPPEAKKLQGAQERIGEILKGQIYFSTDVSDVSWNAPTAQFMAATWIPGAATHSWQSTACAGMSIGRKGMLLAAKVLASSGMDLFTDPKLLSDAKEAFSAALAGQEYKSMLPPDQKPPFNYRDK